MPSGVHKSLADRLMSRTVKGKSCWLWTGTLNPVTGYGKFKLKNKQTTPHRVMYEQFVGTIPDGYVIDHKCHSDDSSCKGWATCSHRACVNPGHLEAVTRAENNRRSNRAVLTMDAVRFIRSSELISATLARRFGIDPSAISRVRNNKRWRAE